MKELFKRSADEIFQTPETLRTALLKRKENSQAIIVPHSKLEIAIPETNESVPYLTDKDRSWNFTDWSFRQLCNLTGSPAPFLKQLPPRLTGTVMQNRLQTMRKGKPWQLLEMQNGDKTLRCVASERYTRLWDVDVLDKIMSFIGNDIKPFKLFAGERDMFLFFINEANPITVGKDTLKRGFFAWNSEVKARTLGFTKFYYRGLCGNCMVFGAQDEVTYSSRHLKNVSDIFNKLPEIFEWFNTESLEEVEFMKAMKKHIIEVTPEALEKKLHKTYRIPKKHIAPILLEAEKDAEKVGDNPNSAWSIVQGITSFAKQQENADKQVAWIKRAQSMVSSLKSTKKIGV